MQEYTDKDELIHEIRKTSDLFIKEFDEVLEIDENIRLDGVDRTPKEMIAYQLGWMELIQRWDHDELEGKEVITPAPGYKWNRLGDLYQAFYDKYKIYSLSELCQMFLLAVDSLIEWVGQFSNDELYQSDKRKWASSTPSNWPIWKWIHINTVAPFKSFRAKIRKWKKLKNSNQ